MYQRCGRIARIFPIDGIQEERLIRELNDIQLLEDADLENELTVEPDILPGREVEIPSGPLKGLTGVVTRRRKQARVTVNVEMLGSSVSVDVDIGDLRLAE